MVQYDVRLGPLLSWLLLWVAIQSAYTVAYPSNVFRRLDWPEQGPSRPETEDAEGMIRQKRGLADDSSKEVSDVIDSEGEQGSLDRDAREPRGISRMYKHNLNRNVEVKGNRNRHQRHIRRRRKRKV